MLLLFMAASRRTAPPPPRYGSALQALPEAIALTLVAALPAFLNLLSERVFEEEKSLLLRAGAVMALPGVWVAWRREPRLWRHPVGLCVAALTAMLLVAALAGVDPREALLGAHARSHGAVTALALAVLFAAMCLGTRTPAGRTRLLVAVLLGSVWPCLYLFVQRAGLDRVDWVGPAAVFMSGSTFGNRVMLGGYLAAVVPLTAAYAWRSRSVVALAVLLLEIAALAGAGSRGAILGFGSGLLAAAAVLSWSRLPRRTFVAACAAAGIIAGAAAFMPPEVLRRQLDPAVGSARVRVLIWSGTADLMKDNPVRLAIGHGPDSLRGLFAPYYTPELGRLEGYDAMPDRAHNDTLDTLVSAGVPGVLLQLALFASVLIAALRVGDEPLRAALVAAAVGHIVEIQFGIPTVTSRLTFLAIGALAVGETMTLPERSPRQGAIGLLVPAAGLGALSPLISRLPSRIGETAASGTVADLIASLSQQTLATPLLYAALLGAALLIARSLATGARSSGATWPLALGLVGGALAVVPLSVTPSRADIISQAAADLERGQKWYEASIAYGEARRLQPNEPHYLAGFGRVVIRDAVALPPAERDARLRSAGEAFERARALAPLDPIRTRHLASFLRVQAWSAGEDQARRMEPLARADRLYAEATARTPGVTPLWIEWARVDLDRGRTGDARQKLDRALALDDTLVESWLLRGDVHRLERAFDKALGDYDGALARAPGHPEALRGRAVTLADLGRTVR